MSWSAWGGSHSEREEGSWEGGEVGGVEGRHRSDRSSALGGGGVAVGVASGGQGMTQGGGSS